jgi:hypothetical protein
VFGGRGSSFVTHFLMRLFIGAALAVAWMPPKIEIPWYLKMAGE